MSNTVHRALRGAKESVCQPTPAQQAWLRDARALLELAEPLAAQGGRVAYHRRGIPEQVVLSYLVHAIRTALHYITIARAQGRPLEERHPGGWSSYYLFMGEPPAKVIQIEPYLQRRS